MVLSFMSGKIINLYKYVYQIYTDPIVLIVVMYIESQTVLKGNPIDESLL